MQEPPTSASDQLQWLVDRAAITDLILSFARCVDDSDHAQYTANFTDDGSLILPFAEVHGRDQILAMPDPPEGWATHHLIGNIMIDIDGDTAHTRAYLTATHVFDATQPSNNAQAGGWYTHELTRTPEGWRFTHVELHVIWEQEKPMIPEESGVNIRPAS